MTDHTPKVEEEILNPYAAEENDPVLLDQEADDAENADETAKEEQDAGTRGPRRDNNLITLSDQERGVTSEANEEAKWNYLSGAAHRRQILTGILSGIERIGNGNHVCVIDFEGVRVIIPFREMMLEEWPKEERTPKYIRAKVERMLGSTVDFLPIAVDMRNRAAVGSRKAAMLERQKHFYMTGRVQPGILIACRVVGVGNNAMVVEAAGVESEINARNVSYDWYADIEHKYASGDLVVARVLSVRCIKDTDRYAVKLSIRAAEEDTGQEALHRLVRNSNYYGEVTGVKYGTVFIRLQAGCNAKTRLYRTKEIPSKFDTVSFHVRGIDEENSVALGFITRIIKRHNRLR